MFVYGLPCEGADITAPKAIIVVSLDRIEKVHLINRKDEMDQAIEFYRHIVLSLSYDRIGSHMKPGKTTNGQ